MSYENARILSFGRRFSQTESPHQTRHQEERLPFSPGVLTIYLVRKVTAGITAPSS